MGATFPESSHSRIIEYNQPFSAFQQCGVESKFQAYSLKEKGSEILPKEKGTPKQQRVLNSSLKELTL